MENKKMIVGKRIDITKLLDEVSKNNRKLTVKEIMNLLYHSIMENEEQNPLFRELKGQENYEKVVNQIVFSMGMTLSVYTLPKKEILELIDICEAKDERKLD